MSLMLAEENFESVQVEVFWTSGPGIDRRERVAQGKLNQALQIQIQIQIQIQTQIQIQIQILLELDWKDQIGWQAQ